MTDTWVERVWPFDFGKVRGGLGSAAALPKLGEPCRMRDNLNSVVDQLAPAPAIELLDGIQAGVLIIDRQRQFLFTNNWLPERVRKPALWFLENSLDQLLTDGSWAEADRALSILFAQEENVCWRSTISADRANKLVVEFSAVPIYRDGSVFAAQLTCIDTSAYEKAAAEWDAIAMENTRLQQQTDLQLEKLGQANREMQALQDLSRMLQLSLDLEHVFQVVVKGLVSGLGYKLALLAVVDDRDNTLVVRSVNTMGADERGDSLSAIGAPPDIHISLEDQENAVVRAVLEGKITTLHSLDHLTPFLHSPDVVQTIRDRLQIHSVVVVPLLAQSKLVGSFFTGITQPKLAEREVALLGAFANQSATAIQNARLYSTVNQRLTEVSMLYTLANEISYSLDLDVVLDSTVNTLKKVLDCRSSCIFLFDKENTWLSIQASSGIKPKWQRDARMRLGEGIAGKVAQEAKSRYIPDTYVEPDFITFDPSVRSLLVVPLMVAGRVIGTLNVDDSKPNAFSSDEGRLLSIAAAQVAVRIDNARLYNDLKERADKLAQAYSELQEASRLKSEFAQNVSHELRTPLTFIKAYVDLLLDSALGPLSERQKEKLEIVSNRTDAIVRLIDNILSLERLERDRIELVPLSIEKVAHVSLQSAEVKAQAGGLELVEDFEPGLPKVLGDGIRLNQVFDNLIHNAIKFSPDGGTITVRIRSDDRYARVDVIDPGIGIPKDKQDKIFERFYQVDGSSKRRFGGTGLGLAIAKEIVEAHSGTVVVESELGQGSTFTFFIPFAPVEDVVDQQEQSSDI